ncbi:MAG: RNA-metabolising metallo-beta-lactamase [Parcubacteria group bacterium GW2011_GWC2_39_14]|nr:MAG: RNA-metabolising metallo-beta-lactamase [Parcubacteria group bacterium GW2011_GWC2_39_14]KKR54753.1 MAG: RNA-metabolising metallo-beta-lactamase [Parcubacteria group bacterium GW2011_GWA2_40_23]
MITRTTNTSARRSTTRRSFAHPRHPATTERPRTMQPKASSEKPRTFEKPRPFSTASKQNFSSPVVKATFEAHFSPNKPTQKLRIMCLGGLEEVGRNMTLLEYGDDIVIVDMGLQFPEENMPGIDYIIPDITYLKDKIKKIRGVIITHGHYDHIGAISHLIPALGSPTIYTAALTAEIIKRRHEEYKLPMLNIQKIDPDVDKITLGSFNIEFFRVNHNIPDSFGVVFNTPVGTVVHTGDFKIDFNPINDKPMDLNNVAMIGSRGVLALLSDSTDAPHSGYQLSETEITHDLEKIFQQAKGRIIVGTFASLINRVQQLIQLGEKYGRKVLLEGRSMNANIEIAQNLGYMHIKPGTLIEDGEFKKLPDEKLMVIGTGAQGEENAVLMRIANNEHRFISIKPGDSIVFSSSVIPGNERTIQTLKDTFYRLGAKVYHYQNMDIHAGGHAKAEDLKLIIKLFKPKYFVPIEANHFMLNIHADIAEGIGIPKANIFIADNGQVMEFSKATPQSETIGVLTKEKVPTEYIMVDGLGVGDVSNIVLRDRQLMAEDGMFVIIATVKRNTGELVGSPDIISRGFVYMKESRELIEEARGLVRTVCKDKGPEHTVDPMEIKNKLRETIGKFLYKQTKRRPMVLPVVIEV